MKLQLRSIKSRSIILPSAEAASVYAAAAVERGWQRQLSASYSALPPSLLDSSANSLCSPFSVAALRQAIKWLRQQQPLLALPLPPPLSPLSELPLQQRRQFVSWFIARRHGGTAPATQITIFSETKRPVEGAVTRSSRTFSLFALRLHISEIRLGNSLCS